MKYNLELFNQAVSEYKEKLEQYKEKTILIIFDKNNKDAFISIAPLSRALHELNASITAIGFGENADALDVLHDVWDTYKNLKESNEAAQALSGFLENVKEKIPEFENIFQEPDLVLNATSSSFDGLTAVDFKTEWYKDYRMDELKETAQILWRDVYNIKQEERVGVGFELIATEEMLGHPLEDYLDSYQIIWAMTTECPGEAALSATSSRDSMLEPMDRISDLRTTLLGCELEKDIDEEPFIAFKKVSEALNISRLKPIDATFAVSGKGYPGKHMFGDAIGYPSPNKKTRWKSPAQMLYKFDFVPQSKFEERDPQARVAFTETLPIDIFIETNLVDWAHIRDLNQNLKDVMDKSDVIYVKSNIEEEHVTNLEVGLVKPDGTKRWVKRSDTDVREKINQEYYEMTGLKTGCMGNIPGGEAFVTPEYIKGKFVGDVVIAIDQSYPLSPEDPFVVECNTDSYKIIKAPEDKLKKLQERKDEAWHLLEESEKHQSLPQEIIDLKKKNFEKIGEFAINTNPKAKLCDYLIVNEKIAKMMHIALGAGYEEDRSTDYHVDIVFDAPRQKLDVYGTDKEGNEHWILKQGEFVI